MYELHGLREALIEQYNQKIAAIADLEIVLRILGNKHPDEVVYKQPLKTFAGGTGYQDAAAFQMAKMKETELASECKVLAVIKEMIQEGGIITPQIDRFDKK
jgi:hypothetical protein